MIWIMMIACLAVAQRPGDHEGIIPPRSVRPARTATLALVQSHVPTLLFLIRSTMRFKSSTAHRSTCS